MSVLASLLIAPYKGLAPFEDSELDALLFFGREREREVIVANMLASKLTVLYGPSGVGKSSILRAAVARRLRELEPTAQVTVLDDWSGDRSLPHVGGDAFLILDQFEEYFLYHDHGPLLDELPALLASRRVHVLIAVREDALARLDAFQSGIPNVFGNRLRLDHLDAAAARAAIVGPLDRWNASAPDDAMGIETALVDAVLEQVASAPGLIEAPYLQLVLERVWDEERAAGSAKLRRETLERLGGARAIVSAHLERALEALPPRDAAIATSALKFLVTPSRTKISHSFGDLVGYTDESPVELQAVLERLASQRILRAVEGERYEIFHDVLAEPVLAWRRDFEARRAVEREREAAGRRQRRLVAVAAGAALLAAAMVALTVYAFAQRGEAGKQRRAAEVQADVALAQQRKAQQKAFAEIAQRTRADRLAQVAVAQRREAEHARAKALASARRAKLSEERARQSETFAQHEQRVAVQEAARANREAGSAKRSALVAKRSALLAKRQTLAAKRAARRALVGDLVSSSAAWIPKDGEHALKDALAAARLEQSPRVESALRNALASFRLRAVFDAGGGAVTAASFSPDQRTVAVGGAAGFVRAFDSVSHERLYASRVGSPVRALAFSPDGARLTVASDDSVARIYDARTGRLVRRLRHAGRVYTAAYAANGRLVTGSVDHKVSVWDGEGTLLHAFDVGAAAELAVSPDGVLVATRIAGDTSARIYDLDSGDLVTSSLSQTGDVIGLAWSRDSARLATMGRRNVYVWNRGGWERQSLLTGAESGLTDVAFTTDGRVVVSSSDSAARVYDAATGNLIIALIGQHQQRVNAVAVSPDGRLVATASNDRTARIWVAPLGRVPDRFAGHTSAVTRVSFSPDGSLLLTASADGTARLWGTATSALAPLGNHDGPANAVALSPNASRVVSGGADGTARIWSIGGAALATLRHEGALTRVAFLDDERVLTAGVDDTARLWSADGAPLATFRHGAPVRAIATAGGRIFTGGDDGVVRAWSLAGVQLWATPPAGHVRALAVVGGTVAVAGADGKARLWSWTDGRPLHVLEGHTDAVVDVAFGANGKLLATASADRTARIWDVRTGRQLQVLGGHAFALTSVAFSPDAKHVVTASVDGDARIWSVDTGKTEHVLNYHVARISQVAYSADGRWIVTAGPFDAGLWYAPTGELLTAAEGVIGSGSLNAAAISSDGGRIVTASTAGTVATYGCDVCGRLPALRDAAAARLASIRSR